MKRYIQIFSILLLLPFFSNGQGNFSYGINATIEYGFTSITNSNAAANLTEEIEPIFGTSFGLQAQYDFNSNIFIRSGINYLKKDIGYVLDGLVFTSDIINGTVSKIESDVNIQSIAIPVDYGFRFGVPSGKISVILGIGAQFNIDLETKSEVWIRHEQIDDVQSITENEVEQFVFPIGIFAGVDFNITKNLVVGIEPNLRYNPHKINFATEFSEVKSLIESGVSLRLRFVNLKT